jgi:hypothetical protein
LQAGSSSGRDEPNIPEAWLVLDLSCNVKKWGYSTRSFCSATWEFGITNEDDYLFAEPHSDPPRAVIVKPDFTCGEILGDFSHYYDSPIFPIQDLEIRLYTAWLAGFGDIILHASGVMREGRGYCFIGDSGAGKSTLAAALAADPAITVLGEDQVVLRYVGGRFWIFGTPWHLDPAMCSPAGAPLEKLYFLDRSLTPGVGLIKPGEGVSRILQTAFIPYYLPAKLPGILDRLALAAEQLPFHSLSYQLGTDTGYLFS